MCIILIFGMIFGVFSYVKGNTDVMSLDDALNMIAGKEGGAGKGGAETITASKDLSGTTDEGASTDEALNLPYDTVSSVKVSLSWTDADTSGRPIETNEPDSFTISIKSPSGKTAESEESSSGSATVSLEVGAEGEQAGTWTITITCVTAGDISVGVLGLRTFADTGNDWTAKATYTYVG